MANINPHSKSKPLRRKPKPDWLRVKLPIGDQYSNVKSIVSNNKLATICESGHCPNLGECWGRKTATFMILGDICTRSCAFCAVTTGKPTDHDLDEPKRVAEAVKLMGIKHAVITSVNRDELADCGGEIWYNTVKEIKLLNPSTTIETLIPDVKAKWDALEKMITGGQEVISHNMETVADLYKTIRPQANYKRSLEQIGRTKDHGLRTKSGIMVGLGETEDQVYQTMDHLVNVGCDVFTIGQYLQPTKDHVEVTEYVHPDQFEKYGEEGLKRGFDYVESGPLIRSSYRAEKHLPHNIT